MKYAITPARMREAEQTAFAAGVPSLLLMETAARAAFDALRGLLPAGGRAVFLCGPGNNGGDGLAMARMWHLAGGKAQIVLPQPPQTANAQTNLRYAQALGIAIKTDSAGLDRPDALVDALFGTGFHGALAENSAAGELVSWANAQDCPILAVDIPSGMDGLSGAVAGACVRASETVTFHCAKRGLLLTAHPELVGRLHVADIGLILLAVSVLLPMAAGGLMTGMTVDQETADSTVTQMLSHLVTIASAIGTLAGTASFVVMIITRLRYPKNKRGKVLMWIFIVLAILTVLAMIALIVACVSCLDSMRNCNL